MTVAQRAAVALAVPLAAALDLQLLDPDDPSAGVRMTVSALAANGFGGAHASALSAALELAGYLAVAPTLADDEHAVTHANSLQLIGVAPEGAVVQLRGVLDRRTKRLAFATATAVCDGSVVARAQLTKSIVRADPISRRDGADAG